MECRSVVSVCIASCVYVLKLCRYYNLVFFFFFLFLSFEKIKQSAVQQGSA